MKRVITSGTCSPTFVPNLLDPPLQGAALMSTEQRLEEISKRLEVTQADSSFHTQAFNSLLSKGEKKLPWEVVVQLTKLLLKV